MLKPGHRQSADEQQIADLTPLRVPVATPTWSIVDVTNIEGCLVVAERAARTPRISIDTETCDWLKNDTGSPTPETVGKLALLQVGLPDDRQAFLLDIVALEGSDADWRSVLRPLIEAPTPQKIVHFGPFERAVFARCGLTFDAGVLDTCALAKSLWKELQEHYPGLTSKSLQSLALHLLGKDISKAEQSSDWRARPLTPQQRAYAALDVEIAAELFETLKRFANIAGIDPLDIDWKKAPERRS